MSPRKTKIKHLRALAASTAYPAERDSALELAAKLEAKEPKPRRKRGRKQPPEQRIIEIRTHTGGTRTRILVTSCPFPDSCGGPGACFYEKFPFASQYRIVKDLASFPDTPHDARINTSSRSLQRQA